MTQLPLHCRHIAGFLHNEHPHTVSGRMGSFIFIHPGKISYLIPNRIYHLRRQSSVAMGIGKWREEQGMGLPLLVVLSSLLFKIVFYCGYYPLPADRIWGVGQ